jgi:hypothetical protein
MKATREASIYEGDAVLFLKPDATWLEPDRLRNGSNGSTQCQELA